MELSEFAGEVSIRAARAAWDRWFSSERFHRKLSQFETRGWVRRVASEDENVEGALRITEEGRKVAMGGRDPSAFWSREWDGRWRLVMFDIPESKRALRLRLCRSLRRLGFGYLQNSVWVSPDPTSEIGKILQGAKLDVEVLTIMDAKPCGGETDADIVHGAWDFARIKRNYEVYMEVLESQPILRRGNSWRNWIAVEWKAWNRAISDDPLLPARLLPAGYRGREVWKRRRTALRRTLGSVP